MVSARDENHPGQNVIDGDDHTFWISTGLFPQEILLQLGAPSPISSVKLTTTNVRNMRVEACSDDTPTNFKLVGEEHDLDERGGRLQTREFPSDIRDVPVGYVKVTILNGWHDFVSVHQVS